MKCWHELCSTCAKESSDLLCSWRSESRNQFRAPNAPILRIPHSASALLKLPLRKPVALTSVGAPEPTPHLTGAALPVLRGIEVLQAALAGERFHTDHALSEYLYLCLPALSFGLRRFLGLVALRRHEASPAGEARESWAMHHLRRPRRVSHLPGGPSARRMPGEASKTSTFATNLTLTIRHNYCSPGSGITLSSS
jgi:hypothetical protein